LCARFSSSALAHAARMAGVGRRSLATLLEHPDVVWLDERHWSHVAEPSDFADIDTPADLTRLGLAPG
jgi:molybdopterin-guanine dinucleotide biosynthesis protein A